MNEKFIQSRPLLLLLYPEINCFHLFLALNIKKNPAAKTNTLINCEIVKPKAYPGVSARKKSRKNLCALYKSRYAPNRNPSGRRNFSASFKPTKITKRAAEA